MKYLKFIPLLLLGVTAFAQDKVTIGDPHFLDRLLTVNQDGSINIKQGAGLATSSTTTRVITSSTNIVLPTGTVQTTVYAPTGTDVYYKLGTGPASVTDGHTVYGGTARIIDVAAPGVNLALSGSGAKVVVDKQ